MFKIDLSFFLIYWHFGLDLLQVNKLVFKVDELL